MSAATRPNPRPATRRLFAVLLAACAMAGCSKDETATPAAGTTGPAATQAKPPPPAVSDKVAAMGADELREAASTALREQRLYAPAGNNAMEYYLALKQKQPDAPAVQSALTDLMPYALIATEQSINREDFDEAQRLYALMEKTDPTAPALPRLKKAIEDGQVAVAKRAEDQKLAAEETAKKQAELEKQRAADQQKAQQDAAQRLAAQQAAEAQQQAAAAQAAATRPASDASNAANAANDAASSADNAAAAAPPPAPKPAPPPAPRVSNELRPISTPAPAYPREAERRRRSGTVEVEFTVGTDGSVTSSRVVSASPPRVFDKETLQAVNRWRFQPVGQPVTTRRTINFKPPN